MAANHAPTFAIGDGKAKDDFGTLTDIGLGLVVQPDGRLLIAGSDGTHFTLARHNSDGSLDTTFDGDGHITTSIGAASTDQGASVLLQSDGKILVAGTT